jgi:hypothetical protein
MVETLYLTDLQWDVLEVALEKYKIDIDNKPNCDQLKRLKLWAIVDLLSQIRKRKGR